MSNRRTKEIPEVSIKEPTPRTGRIAWHFEITLVRFMQRIFNILANPFKSVISYALEETIDVIEDYVRKAAMPIFNELESVDSIPDWLKKPIMSAKNDREVGAAALLIPIAMAGVIAAVMAVVAPMQRRIQYEVEQVVQTYRPDPITLMRMLYRQNIPDDVVTEWMKELGVSGNMVNGFSELAKSRVDVNQLSSAFLREAISETEFDDELRHRGYLGNEFKVIKELVNIIPGPGDLVRMAVREAWNDTIANQFGYDEDWPEEFGDWGAKIGLSIDWTKRFWRAHWELPGVREGFEMLHRRIIDDKELELLLQARDIPSFWRKGVTELSYNPYTRVDVRRMYKMGVVDDNEVLENYLDLGYSEERAKKLTEWTVLEYGESSRDLSKSDVIAAHTDNTITDDEALTMLMALGYDENEIGILLARSDLVKQRRFEKEFVETVRVNYVGNAIERHDVIAKLNQLNPPGGFVDERLSIWDLQKERQITLASKADIQKFLVNGIITKQQAIEELSKRKYPQYTIEWYINLWLLSSEEE